MNKSFFMFSSGKDLIGVQNLLKKHQALQAEISGHEPRIKAVTQKGEAMVEEGNHLTWFSVKCKLSKNQFSFSQALGGLPWQNLIS